ncbi:MAG: pyridoxamine 5'-phosphate oxidase family protein [Acidimicrobiales bacterium]
MARWSDFVTEAPDLAARVEARFTATKHHVLATLRADGSPRVSGTEVQLSGGDLQMGSMPGARKALDLQRDGRFALHANPGDGTMDGGDAKVTGRAEEVVDDDGLGTYAEASQPPPGPFHLFRLHLDEVVLTSVHPDGDRLVVELWRPGHGVTVVDRK